MTRARITIALALLTAAPAAQAVTVGKVANSVNEACTGQNNNAVQAASAGNLFVVPAAGVITAWSHNARGISQARLKLKVFRPLGGGSYLAVGESAFADVAQVGLHENLPASIRVQAGDVLGLGLAPDADLHPPSCFDPNGSAADQEFIRASDVAPGDTTTFPAGPFNVQLNVSAELSPDPAVSIVPNPVQQLPGPARDVTKPTITATAAKGQDILKQGGVNVTVRPSENCSLSATGAIPLASSSARKKKPSSIKLKGSKAAGTAGKAAKLKLGLAKKDRSKLRKALRKGNLKAKVSLTATDPAGNAAASALSVKLKRP